MKKWIYRILLVVCLCVFGYSAYNLWDIYSQKQQVENETKQLEKNVIKKKDKEKAGQVMRTHIINQQEAIERNLAGPEK